jgi:hypothetical protein
LDCFQSRDERKYPYPIFLLLNAYITKLRIVELKERVSINRCPLERRQVFRKAEVLEKFGMGKHISCSQSH